MKAPFLNKNNWNYRLIQFFIFIAHFVLLGWMFYVLYEAGTATTTALMLHFTGMAILGAFLIRFTSWITMRQFKKEMEK